MEESGLLIRDPRRVPHQELGQHRGPGEPRAPPGSQTLGPFLTESSEGVSWAWTEEVVWGWTQSPALGHGGPAGRGCLSPAPTTRDDAFQADDVGVVELTHDGRLAQEVPPLSLCVAGFEGLDGHGHIPLPRHPQPPVADFS